MCNVSHHSQPITAYFKKIINFLRSAVLLKAENASDIVRHGRKNTKYH